MSRVIGIVVVIAVGIGAFMFRSAQREKVNNAIDEMPERIMAVCQRCEGFAQYKDYILEHADRAHDYAMTVAYEEGGRRRSPKFDSKKYALAFSESLVNQGKMSRTDQKLDQFLRQLQIDLEQAAGRGEFD